MTITSTNAGPPCFPSSLSPSRASDFTTCPLLFRFRSIDRLPEAPSPAAVRGTVVHRALEWLFDLPPVGRTQQAARELVERATRELEELAPLVADALRPSPDEPATVDADGLLASYFSMEDPQRLEPHARELGLSATIDGDFEIRGFIDRIDRTPDGLIRIVDYKTGRSPSEAFAGKAMFQMRFYALAWWRMTSGIPTRLQLMYLGDGRILRLDPDEHMLEATERRILALREAISRSADAEDFAPTPSRLCDWCSHRPLCPAWGGTPPELPPREEWPTAMAARRSAPSADSGLRSVRSGPLIDNSGLRSVRSGPLIDNSGLRSVRSGPLIDNSGLRSVRSGPLIDNSGLRSVRSAPTIVNPA